MVNVGGGMEYKNYYWRFESVFVTLNSRSGFVERVSSARPCHDYGLPLETTMYAEVDTPSRRLPEALMYAHTSSEPCLDFKVKSENKVQVNITGYPTKSIGDIVLAGYSKL